MRWLIIFLLLSTLVFGSGRLELKIDKTTNGSYIWHIPHYEMVETYGYFLNKKELSLKFFAPRNDKSSLNHYSAYLEESFGLMSNGFYILFSIYCEHFFEGNNSEDKSEHNNFGNSLTIGYEF